MKARTTATRGVALAVDYAVTNENSEGLEKRSRNSSSRLSRLIQATRSRHGETKMRLSLLV